MVTGSLAVQLVPDQVVDGTFVSAQATEIVRVEGPEHSAAHVHTLHIVQLKPSGVSGLQQTTSARLLTIGTYTRLQTVWSLPGHSRQTNKDHSPRCHRRPNGPGRLADKVVQPTTQSAEGCTC